MNRGAYYNEIDPFAAQWLRNLIAAGAIAAGDVDERSIEDVRPDDLLGYTQCHFFAGIGGWSLALRFAGWPDDQPAWTGSCPCQPFSAAGKGGGFADERHLWPAFHHLIQIRRPVVCFGEQVASPDGLAWLDLVAADLEGADYAIGAVDCCAAGFGAPQIRQRLYWWADDTRVCRMEGANRGRLRSWNTSNASAESWDGLSCDRGEFGGLGGAMQSGWTKRWAVTGNRSASGCCGLSGMARASSAGLEERRSEPGNTGPERAATERDRSAGGRPGPVNGFWGAADWLLCRDAKWRPAEPGTFPLAHGIPGRVGRLRAYGNAILPPQAADFVRAYRDAIAEAQPC